jgi:hypothetical protein
VGNPALARSHESFGAKAVPTRPTNRLATTAGTTIIQDASNKNAVPAANRPKTPVAINALEIFNLARGFTMRLTPELSRAEGVGLND